MSSTEVEQVSDTAPQSKWSRLSLRQTLPFVSLVVLYVITILISPGYLDPTQISGLLQLAAIMGVVAIGQTFVILIGGIDLSVGAVVTLTNLAVAATVGGSNGNIFKGLAVALAIGLAVGLFNGAIIAWLKVPDLVGTLATMSIVIGIGFLATNGSPKGSASPNLVSFVTTRFGGIFTGAVVAWIVLSILAVFILRKTAYGRRIYAVGLNRDASRYAGIRVNWLILSLYAISGVTAGFAGFILTGYTGSSYLASGTTYQMASIAAVILGGTSMFGGKGGYGGTVAGVLITVLLTSILRVIGIAQAGQNIAYGVIILVMLLAFRNKEN